MNWEEFEKRYNYREDVRCCANCSNCAFYFDTGMYICRNEKLNGQFRTFAECTCDDFLSNTNEED